MYNMYYMCQCYNIVYIHITATILCGEVDVCELDRSYIIMIIIHDSFEVALCFTDGLSLLYIQCIPLDTQSHQYVVYNILWLMHSYPMTVPSLYVC